MKILIVSVRLGTINRGFETFANELFLALEKEGVNVYIAQAKATDASKRRMVIRSYSPGKRVRQFFSKVSSRLGSAGFIEEKSFAFPLYYQIQKLSPDIVYMMEINLANAVDFLKQKLNGKFKIVFSNGAPYTPNYFLNKDYFIQQHLDWTYRQALEANLPKKRLTYIPYGFNLYENYSPVSKKALRIKLGITDDKTIFLSVCALNKFHKRVDYIIDECTPLLRSGNYRLICLGQYEEETEQLLRTYSDLISDGSLLLRSVPHDVVKDYYKVADLFLLGSLHEGFGRVVVEAISYGLTCVLHDFAGFREIGGGYAHYINMKAKGELANFLATGVQSFPPTDLVSYIFNQYDWSVLIADYIKYFNSVLSQI